MDHSAKFIFLLLLATVGLILISPENLLNFKNSAASLALVKPLSCTAPAYITSDVAIVDGFQYVIWDRLPFTYDLTDNTMVWISGARDKIYKRTSGNDGVFGTSDDITTLIHSISWNTGLYNGIKRISMYGDTVAWAEKISPSSWKVFMCGLNSTCINNQPKTLIFSSDTLSGTPPDPIFQPDIEVGVGNGHVIYSVSSQNGLIYDYNIFTGQSNLIAESELPAWVFEDTAVMKSGLELNPYIIVYNFSLNSYLIYWSENALSSFSFHKSGTNKILYDAESLLNGNAMYKYILPRMSPPSATNLVPISVENGTYFILSSSKNLTVGDKFMAYAFYQIDPFGNLYPTHKIRSLNNGSEINFPPGYNFLRFGNKGNLLMKNLAGGHLYYSLCKE